MHLVFGGAYQGKLDYAKERYGYGEADVYRCASFQRQEAAQCQAEVKVDYSFKVIDHLEAFILNCVRCGKEAKEILEMDRENWRDSVFICTDISSGIVPCDEEMRAWREMVGRTLMYLGKEAEEVTRMFCGIPQKIKPLEK